MEAVKDVLAIVRDITLTAAPLAGLWLAYQRLVPARDQASVARNTQIHELFGKCIEQLESEKMAVRLGGIILLKRLMAEHADLVRPTATLLTAYVREKQVGPKDDAPEDIRQILDILK